MMTHVWLFFLVRFWLTYRKTVFTVDTWGSNICQFFCCWSADNDRQRSFITKRDRIRLSAFFFFFSMLYVTVAGLHSRHLVAVLICTAELRSGSRARATLPAVQSPRVAVLSPKTVVLKTSGLSAWRLWYFFSYFCNLRRKA